MNNYIFCIMAEEYRILTLERHQSEETALRYCATENFTIITGKDFVTQTEESLKLPRDKTDNNIVNHSHSLRSYFIFVE